MLCINHLLRGTILITIFFFTKFPSFFLNSKIPVSFIACENKYTNYYGLFENEKRKFTSKNSRLSKRRINDDFLGHKSFIPVGEKLR